MKLIISACILMLYCLNFSALTAQEEGYESISLTADDHAGLISLNQKFVQAAKNNDTNQAEQLITQGVDINYQDEVGNTAAHYAWSADTKFYSCYNEIRGMLFIAQARLDIPNHENKTAQDYLHEIKLPFTNMNSDELMNYIVDSLSKKNSSSM